MRGLYWGVEFSDIASAGGGVPLVSSVSHVDGELLSAASSAWLSSQTLLCGHSWTGSCFRRPSSAWLSCADITVAIDSSGATPSSALLGLRQTHHLSIAHW